MFWFILFEVFVVLPHHTGMTLCGWLGVIYCKSPSMYSSSKFFFSKSNSFLHSFFCLLWCFTSFFLLEWDFSKRLIIILLLVILWLYSPFWGIFQVSFCMFAHCVSVTTYNYIKMVCAGEKAQGRRKRWSRQEETQSSTGWRNWERVRNRQVGCQSSRGLFHFLFVQRAWLWSFRKERSVLHRESD